MQIYILDQLLKYDFYDQKQRKKHLRIWTCVKQKKTDQGNVHPTKELFKEVAGEKHKP